MMTTAIDRKKLDEVLGTLKDPELGAPLVKLNMIRNVEVTEGTVSFEITLTTPACPLKDQIRREAEEACKQVPGVESVRVKFGSQVTGAPKAPAAAEEKAMIPQVKNVIAIGSGKGGVGKSTVAVNLALALAKEGASVGLLDADVYGPSVPKMISAKTCQLDSDGKTIVPAENFGIKVVSMGFFLKENDPVIWRGPMLHGILQKFLGDVKWGPLDYLLIDLPPGTGDVQLSLSQMIPVTAAVAVTTPQDVALLDVRRAVQMFKKVRIELAGVIENMSGFECPHCKEHTAIFGSGAGEKIQAEFGIPVLGRVALSKAVMDSGEQGVPVVHAAPQDIAAQSLSLAAKQLAASISVLNYKRPKMEIAT